MRILFLSRWLPYPPDNGSKIRIFNILRYLATRHEVSLITLADRERVAHQPTIAALKEFCAGVRVLPHGDFRRSSARALAGFLSPQPRFLVDTYQPEVAAAVIEELARHAPDVVVASQIDMAPYALAIGSAPLVLEELELSTYMDAAAQSFRDRLTLLKLKRYLGSVLPRFAACTVASERECAQLQRLVPNYSRVAVIPNSVDVQQYRGEFGPVEAFSLIFSGALTYRANEDAMRYFLADVYPRVCAQAPDTRLRVTGRVPSDLVALPTGPGVEFTGYLSDVRPLIAQSYAAVVPIRLGGGTRLKILEAMALGTPVISTRKGAEGLGVTPGKDILLADRPMDFAEATVQLLRSPELRARLSTEGRRLVEERYDWASVGNELLGVLETAASSRSSH